MSLSVLICLTCLYGCGGAWAVCGDGRQRAVGTGLVSWHKCTAWCDGDVSGGATKIGVNFLCGSVCELCVILA